MLENLQQLLLLTSALIIPLYLLWKNNSTWVVIYFCATMHLDILSMARGEVNLTFLKFFSLVSVPFTIKELKKIDIPSNPVLKISFIFLGYAAILGFIFGYALPWPDTSGSRIFYDQSLIKSIRQFGTIFCEFSLAFILSKHIQKVGLQFVIRTLLVISLLLIFGATLEAITNSDIYALISQGKPFLDPFRLRGFSYEPRGLAHAMTLACVYAYLTVNNLKYFCLLILLFCATSYLTTSMVGTILMIVLIPTFLLTAFFSREERGLLLKKAVAFCIIAIITLAFNHIAESLDLNIPSLKERILYSKKHMSDRDYITSENKFISKFEVHDAAALSFLKKNPLYLISGTGLGTMGIASSPYLLPRDIHTWGNRSDNNPHMGAVFIISQYGILGASLLLLLIFYSAPRMTRYDLRFFLILLTLWLFQMRYGTILILALMLQTYKVSAGKKDASE